MAFRRRPPRREPGPAYPGPPPDEQVTIVEGRPPPPPPPPDDLPPGPPPGEPDRYLWPWLVLLLVLLAIGGGLAAYFATRGDGHDKKVVAVPHVVGFKEQAALARLRRAKLDPVVSRSFSKKPAGFVISQRPFGGQTVAKGRAVEVIVSKGPSAIAVPNVVSLGEADAVALLTKAGLKADVFQVPSRQKAGKVLAQSPAAGQKVGPGSPVRLNVSKGPTQTTTVVTTTAPTTTTTHTTTATTATTTTTSTTTATTTETASASVPDLVGQTLPAAVSQLLDAQLFGDSYPVNSSEPGGTVVAQNLDAGTTVDSGSVVRLNVSVGTSRPKLPVPPVTGATEKRARLALSKTFTVRAIYRSASSASERGHVVGQTPGASQDIRRWAQVIIYVGK